MIADATGLARTVCLFRLCRETINEGSEFDLERWCTAGTHKGCPRGSNEAECLNAAFISLHHTKSQRVSP